MKSIFTALTAGAMLIAASTSAFAQGNVPALTLANQTNACGDVAATSARYLEGGRLEVTCPRGSVSQAAAGGSLGLAGGLSAGAIAGIVAAVVVVGIVLNDDSASTTTTP